MIGVYIILGVMVSFATVIGVLDWLAERQHRRARENRRSA
jgi:hypothetical protein